MTGCCLMRPTPAYGSPDDLKELVDAAHGLGLMMFLDVVYNHFGPDGNYLSAYAPQFFRDDVKTPWGPAIDFRRREVRDYFTCNVLMWLMEYRFDGLRFDAVHAIQEQDWVEEMAATVRADRWIRTVMCILCWNITTRLASAQGGRCTMER